MVNDLMKRERWTRSYTLSVLRSKFESEERYQEVEYVNNLIKKEEKRKKEQDNKSKNKNAHYFHDDY